jgi:hypothetical protein
MAELRLEQQIVFVLRKDGEGRIAHFTTYRVDRQLRSDLTVFRPVRTLLPPGRIAHATEHAVDLDRRDLRRWFESRGFEVIDSLEGPEVDRPLGYR